MDDIEITVQIRRNGRPVEGLDPLIRRLTVAESFEFDFFKSQSEASDLPGRTELATPSIVIITADRLLTLFPNAASQSPISINPAGILLAIDCGFAFGGPQIYNPTEETAHVSGLIGGS